MYVGRLVSVLLECFHDDSWPLAVHVHDIVTDWSYYYASDRPAAAGGSRYIDKCVQELASTDNIPRVFVPIPCN